MRRRAASGSPFEDEIGFSRAVRVGDRVLVSGTAPVWPDGSCDPDPAVQANRCLEIVAAALADLGAGLADVVRTRVLLVDAADAAAVSAVHGAVFGEVRPAATMISQQRRAWAAGSGSQPPSCHTGAVPETSTRSPTRTARLNP